MGGKPHSVQLCKKYIGKETTTNNEQGIMKAVDMLRCTLNAFPFSWFPLKVNIINEKEIKGSYLVTLHNSNWDNEATHVL